MPSILKLCARSEKHPDLHRRLSAACREVRRWELLLHLAEEQAMAPLLNRHLAPLQQEVPTSFQRGLLFLSLRHRRANAALMESLQHVLSLLQDKGIPSLVLKGAALCRTVYPESGLRPMRDIDLLLAKEDIQQSHALLQQQGFRISTAVLPDGYHHMPPLHQKIDGVPVCIELHHDLFPKEPPYTTQLPFASLYRKARPFSLHGISAYTLGDEDMLWHLYQHGFRTPLTFEPCKLITVADIISLVEKRMDTIDWDRMNRDYPQLIKVLHLFHYVTPWNDRVGKQFPWYVKTAPQGIGESYKGWPRVKFKRDASKKMHLILNTIAPPRWWLMLFYSTGNRFSLLWCILVRHPIHIIRWVKIRGNICKRVRDTMKK